MESEWYKFSSFNLHFECVVGHGECLGNSMWTILWCKAVSNARHISSKIMASLGRNITLSSPSVHFHHPDFEGFRPGRGDCRSCWIRFSVANPGYVCLHCVLHLPILPTSAEQEHDNSLFGSIFPHYPCVSLLAFSSKVPAWTPWCIVVHSPGVLDPEYRSTHVYFVWRMSWNLEGFLILGFQGSLAYNQAFPIIWCHGLVRPFQLFCWLVFGKLLSQVELLRLCLVLESTKERKKMSRKIIFPYLVVQCKILKKSNIIKIS